MLKSNKDNYHISQLSEEGENSWGKQQVKKKIFLEKLRNKMSLRNFEKFQKIPGNLEVTQMPRAVAYSRKI